MRVGAWLPSPLGRNSEREADQLFREEKAGMS